MSFNHLPIVTEDTALWGGVEWLKNKGWGPSPNTRQVEVLSTQESRHVTGHSLLLCGKEGKKNSIDLVAVLAFVKAAN